MARRLNTKFVTNLAMILGGLGVAGLIAQKVLIHEHPQKYIEAAMSAAQHGNYPEAARALNKAASLDRTSPELLVRLGDASREASRTDTQWVGKDKQAYDRALEIDPRNVPALQHLLASWWADAQLSPSTEVYDRCKTLAGKLLEINPDDTRAEAQLHIATLQAWMAGLQTDPKTVNDNIAALQKLSAKDPANAEVPYFIARAKVAQAEEAARLSHQDEADRLFAEAAALFDGPLKADKVLPTIILRACQTYVMLSRADLPHASRYTPRVKEMLDRTKASVPPTDASYPDIMLTVAEFTAQTDLPGAETMYRDLLKQRPDDQNVRLALAHLLANNPSKRDEAIAILSQPVKPGEDMVGTKALLLPMLQSRTTLELTNMRIDAYEAAVGNNRPMADREKLIAQINDGYSILSGRLGEVAPVLKLKGKLQLAQGQYVDAIQTLTRVVSMLGPKAAQGDDEINYLLAKAYLRTQQNGQAADLLGGVVSRHGTFLPARLLLAQLLLRQNDIAGAKAQVDVLEQQAPQLTEVVKLRLALLDPVKDADKAKEYYRRLPEANLGQMMDKAQVAAAIGQRDDAVRLLDLVRTATPNDPDATMLLARVLSAQGNRDKAKAVVADALQAHPDSTPLQLTKKQLDNASPKEMAAALQEAAEKISDPVARELQLSALAQEQGNSDEAIASLLKARQLRPDDAKVAEQLFDAYMHQHKMDDAEALVDTLSKANADQANGLFFRFRLLLARGKVQEAIDTGMELTRRLPEFGQSYLALGRALQAAGRTDEAITKYSLALQKQSNNTDAMRGLMECYYSQGKPEDAKRTLVQARKTFPNDVSFQQAEINHEMTYGNPESVLPGLEAKAAKLPDDPNVQNVLGKAYARTAQVKASQSDMAASTKYLQKAEALYSACVAKWPDEGAFYVPLAELDAADNKVDAGEKLLNALAARDAWKARPEPLLLLAEYDVRVSRPQQAEKALRDALSVTAGKPTEADVRQKLVGFLAQYRRFNDALALLDTADKTNPRVWQQRIDVLIAAGRFADAEASLKGALLNVGSSTQPVAVATSQPAGSPTELQLRNRLAFVYMNGGRIDEALAQLSQVLAADPKNAQALLYSGVIELQRPGGEPERAVKYLSLARDLAPTDADTRANLGEALRRSGNLDDAGHELEAALQINPLGREARLRLVNLYMTVSPPRWSDAERLLREAQATPQLKNDPAWSATAAEMWVNRGDNDQALSNIRTAVQMAPNDVNLFRQSIAIYLRTGNYQTVLDQTAPLMAKNDNAWWLHQARALAKKGLGDKDGAMGEFESALRVASAAHDEEAARQIVQVIGQQMGLDEAMAKIQPHISGPQADTNLEVITRWRMLAALVQQGKGDSPAAAALIDQVMAGVDKLSAPSRESALRLASMIYLASKSPAQAEKAVDVCRRLLQLTPDDIVTLNNIACLLAESVTPPRPAEALEYSQHAYDLTRKRGINEPMILDTQGWILTLNGRAAEGTVLLQQAVAQRPFIEGHYHLAEAYSRKSYPEEARAEVQAARQMIDVAERDHKPVDPGIKSKIEALALRLQQAQQSDKARAEAPTAAPAMP